MSETESKGLAIVTDAIGHLPAPIKTSFLKAFSDLLGGLTAIPAAKLKQYAQSIEDTTVARSAAAAMIAKAAADEASKDPLLIQAAAEIYLPTTLRKVKNKLSVAQSAAEHLGQAASSDTNNQAASPPEDDWMNTFMRFAEDASSDRLQDLFGRILAGQVLRPGAFGLATLRALSELDQTTANDFNEAWTKSVGEAVDYGPEWQRGDGFSRWKRLSEVGLMAPTSISQFLPEFHPLFNDYAPWSPMHAGGTSLLVFFEKGATTRWEHIEFTRIGREIGSLLKPPNYEENMRLAASRLPRGGLKRIELHPAGKSAQVLWQS